MSVLDACPRGPRERCNHLNADVCCGGGYDGPCGCPNCHTEWAQTAQRPPLIHLTSKERSSELRAFADVLRDTGRYGVDFADVERASLLSEAADELDRQRAEIERLARENEDFLDERQRRIHEILRLRAALDSLLTALNFRDSGERLFAVYGMPAIDAANAAAALLRDGCPPVETTARRMTRAEADAMNRAFWRSVEIIDDIDDREEVAPGDARYYRPSEKASGEHVHSDECWEPDSGCDMGRNDAHAVVEERCEHGIPRRFCTAVHPSENGSGERHG